jgi:hypothetical protein
MIKDFCEKHGACREGQEWALANCKSMQEVWDTSRPEYLIWVATRHGVLTDRELRLFACWSVRQIWHLLKDERSKNAVEVAERYAIGDATETELAAAAAAANAAWAAAAAAANAAAAAAAAWAAAANAAWAAARADARADAWADAWAAAWAAARAAARDAAWAAARAAARDAAWAAARAAARAAQAEYLHKNCTPNFE